MPVWDNIGGVYHKAKPYSNIGGVWVPDKKDYDNIAGVWRQGFVAGVLPNGITTHYTYGSNSSGYSVSTDVGCAITLNQAGFTFNANGLSGADTYDYEYVISVGINLESQKTFATGNPCFKINKSFTFTCGGYTEFARFGIYTESTASSYIAQAIVGATSQAGLKQITFPVVTENGNGVSGAYSVIYLGIRFAIDGNKGTTTNLYGTINSGDISIITETGEELPIIFG